MKKILLVTWYANYNYGTALQAYALKSVIEDPSITGLMEKPQDWHYKCDLLPHTPCRRKQNGMWKKLFVPTTYLSKLGYLCDKKVYNSKKALFKERENAFHNFISDNFVFASDHNVQNNEELSQIAHNYDVVLAGSDQIWNPVSLDPVYLLQWVPDGKKISYGSSLSVGNIAPADEPVYQQALNGFKAISIRDRKCRAQLEAIACKSVTTVVDPVILLGRNALLQGVRDIVSPPFVFCYFLGGKREHRVFALSEAQKQNLQVHAVINVGSDYSADKPFESVADWDVGPWKFVSYIKSANVVITDSFHATVISTLCHTPFIVLEKDPMRPEQNNRILEFLDAVGLRNRWKANNVDTAISEAQWEQADSALSKMRKSSLDWLISNL